MTSTLADGVAGASTANGRGFIDFDPTVSASMTLTADAALMGTAQAVDPTATSSAVMTGGPATATGQAVAPAKTATSTAFASEATGTAAANDPVAHPGVIALAQNARADGQAYSPAGNASVVTQATQAAGHAYDATTTAVTSSSATVTPAVALGWGTAQGAQTDAVDGGPGPTITPIAEVADATGSALAAIQHVLLRPGTATGQGFAYGAIANVFSLDRRLHAGTPREISPAMAGTPVERRDMRVLAVTAAVGTHAGEPALV